MNALRLDRAVWPRSVRIPVEAKAPRPAPHATASIYMVWCHHVLHEGLCLTQALENWPDVKAFELNAPLFTIGRPAIRRYHRLHARMASDLGVPHERLERLFGWDLYPGHTVELSRGFLRWCPECMRTGYHSSLYQHAAVSHCPVHGLPLAFICPNCRRSITVTTKIMIVHPFSCPHCEELLLETAAVPIHEEHEAVDRKLQSRYAGLAASSVLIPGHGRTVNPRPDWVLSEYRYRLTRRASMCAPKPPQEMRWEFPRFRTERFSLSAGDEASQVSMVADQKMMVNFMQWLWTTWPHHSRVVLRIVERVGHTPHGGRIRARVPVLSAAIAQMLMAYALSRPFYREYYENPQDAFKVASYAYLDRTPIRLAGGASPAGRMGACELLMEMLSFLAIAIVRCARTPQTVDLSWQQFIEPAALTPILMHDARAAATVDIRTRANEALLARLARRYSARMMEGDRWLDAELDAQSTVCPAVVAHVDVPGVERLGASRL